MNYKQKLEYLYGYKNKVAQIAIFIEEHERWMAIGAKVNQAFNSEPSSGSGDGSSRVERSAMELARIDKEIENAIADRDAILHTIRTRSRNKRYVLLLELRFVGGMSYNRIANVIDKDVRTVQRVMHKAIDSLDI